MKEYLKRKIYDKMLDWKQSLEISKKALIIKGLRQVGKTTIVRQFAKENFGNFIYINFLENQGIKSVFNGDFNVDELIKKLSTYFPNSKFIPYKTVLIFDELQECANARSAIKFFMIDGRFDIIATGSLMSLKGYNQNSIRSVPVGFEYFLTMTALDFEEYLWAKNLSQEIIDNFKECYENKVPVDPFLNNLVLDHLKEYICVGGMPEAVNLFLKTHDIGQVHTVKKNILESFKDDFGKHLNEKEEQYYNKKELEMILNVFESIPNQLAKENKKFKYSNIEKGAKARSYEKYIQYLHDYGLISICYNLKLLQNPLKAFINESIFKIYFNDIGLLMTLYGNQYYKNILEGDLLIFKGAIYENMVAELLFKKEKEFFYYKKDNGLEIDFITMINSDISAIEVKSTNNNVKSLKTLMNDNNEEVKHYIKLINGNVGFNNGILSLPHYMVMYF